ncbi:MAG: hypothetical protein SFT93_01780 [Rickettsiaceae bacterium]|nr:hypothetical protein [Rickettsiaceae bacterium]
MKNKQLTKEELLSKAKGTYSNDTISWSSNTSAVTGAGITVGVGIFVGAPLMPIVAAASAAYGVAYVVGSLTGAGFAQLMRDEHAEVAHMNNQNDPEKIIEEVRSYAFRDGVNVGVASGAVTGIVAADIAFNKAKYTKPVYEFVVSSEGASYILGGGGVVTAVAYAATEQDNPAQKNTPSKKPSPATIFKKQSHKNSDMSESDIWCEASETWKDVEIVGEFFGETWKDVG